jgi:transcriptional regulator with XRE-family HTH domain
MPRPPSRPSVLRTARQLLGVSQQELSRRIGCSKVTIEKFENGTAGISEELALRIALELDVDLDQLLDNSMPEAPLTIMGEALSFEIYEKWKIQRQWHADKDSVDRARLLEGVRRTLLLDAAAKAGKYRMVSLALEHATTQLVKKFGLEEEFAAERSRHGFHEHPQRFYLQVIAGKGLDLKSFEQKRAKLYSKLKRAAAG